MTKETNEILVIGGTGKTGRRLVRTLRASGERVRAASRSGEVRFDWTRPATWQPAVAGASVVYLTVSADPAVADDFVAQAVKWGVGRFVALSGRGIDRIDRDFSPSMLGAEQAVRDSGAEWTIIRPNNFHQNFDEDLWRQPLVDGRLALPMGATPEPFIDAQDVADVAAALLTEEGHHGQVYELSGRRALTFAEAVATIAEASGRSIQYVELTPEEYRSEVLAEGYSEADATALTIMFAGMRAGYLAQPTDTVRQLLGRDPIDFDTYADQAATGGAWS
ncbi:NAD(P)H-binding protein [Micromonospora craniellae]|uniref:SDR family NAD(P)-dependent oxidoreductase n=1 Tax=Micromonospora craniellae TaxID=2294034 RepID=A0A372G485_9ACTN|nr:NAD(P)H-binding protein [Micromonospora craniellae]QOC92148.1 NAD(P)H-binding protein [Micromonospora craniellae]RFS47576.1 SDR family NAD(P)-dependent oxidoreductase [Micromonospora craniellae]